MKYLITIICLFIVILGNSQELEDDYYFVQSNIPGKVWTYQASDSRYSVHLKLEDYDGSNKQKFRFLKNDDGSYQLMSWSVHYLVPQGNKTGSVVNFLKDNTNRTANWDIIIDEDFKNDNGEIRASFRSFNSLMITSLNPEGGTPRIRLNLLNKSENQQFILTKKVEKANTLMVTAKPLLFTATLPLSKPKKVKLEIAFMDLSVDIHNSDCTRMQGDISATMTDKRLNILHKPLKERKVLNFTGNQECDFKVRKEFLYGQGPRNGKYDDTNEKTWISILVFEVDKTSLDNGDLVLWLKPYLSGGHKGGGLFDFYDCNVKYNIQQTIPLDPQKKNYGLSNILKFPGDQQHTIRMYAEVGEL